MFRLVWFLQNGKTLNQFKTKIWFGPVEWRFLPLLCSNDGDCTIL